MNTPNPSEPFTGILCFSTAKFDEMKRFLTAMGFSATDATRTDQMLPLFTQGRGAHIKRGDFEFNLEEDPSRNNRACFNMLLPLSKTEIDQAINSGFKYTRAESLYGVQYNFKSPDGGEFTVV